MNKTNLFGVDNVADAKYTRKVSVPQYLPNNDKPSLFELCSLKRYEELVSHIKRSTGITEVEREFLLTAATRHIVFNYDKIADYYCNSSKEMQELMEESALVIVDFDDAIMNGYIDAVGRVESLRNKQVSEGE